MLDESGMHTNYYKGTQVLMVQTLSGRLFCSVDGRIYALEEIPMHEEVSRNFDTEKHLAEAKKPKKQNIPSMNHPWRKDNFMKHVYAMYGKEETWAG